MPKKYKHIEILEETLEKPSKIKITYEDDSVDEVTNPYTCYSRLCEFAKQEGFVTDLRNADIKKLLSDESRVTYKTGKEHPSSLADLDVSEKPDTSLPIMPPSFDEDEPIVENAEGKPKRISIKRIGAWFLAIIAVGGSLAGGILIGKKMANKASRNNHFIQIIDTPEYDDLSYAEKLALLEENSQFVIDGFDDMVNGKLDSSKDLDQCIENLANILLSNINEISDYVTGRTATVSGTAEKIDLRFLFDKTTVDYCAVDYFNDLRDDIVDAAYSTKSVSQTKSCVTKFNEEFVKFVFGGKPLPYNINGNTVYYTFESLNPSAQMTILTMGMTILNIEHDFSVNINGEEYNRIVAITEACELNATIYQELLETQKIIKTK